MNKLPFLLIFSFLSSFSFAQQINYTDGKGSWDPDSLGNHRVVVSFTGKGGPARVVIPWRRPDTSPELKRIIIQDAVTKQKITNVSSLLINNEKGDIVFEPVSGPGDYYINYLPSKNEGRANYPKGVYLAPENTASDVWLKTINTKHTSKISDHGKRSPIIVCR